MLRAPFKSRPSRGDSDAIPSTRPTPDLISDGDTPSLPRVEAGGVAERAWGLSDARPAGTESGRALPNHDASRRLGDRAELLPFGFQSCELCGPYPFFAVHPPGFRFNPGNRVTGSPF